VTEETRAQPEVRFAPWPPQKPRPTSEIVARLLDGRTFAIDEVRLLAARLKAAVPGRKGFCVGVVSATAGEGKSSLCLGLASVLAGEPGRKTLIIELDTRRPSLENALGLPRMAGLAEWLGNPGDSVPVRRVHPPGFALLAAGLDPLRRPEILATPRMTGLLAAARAEFEYVLIDCPPVLPVADAILIQDGLDGFAFVVRARHSPRETVMRAVSRLKPEKVLGTVFNDQREILPSYYNYGDRYYGVRA
jgi:Mrp family chromosome partitioning ATPase